jgi:hypothetical protein
MPKRSSKGPRNPDVNQTAWRVVQEATQDESEDVEEPPPEKNPAAVALGKLGGAKGGKARAEKLSDKRRSEIAKKAAEARWGKKDEGESK